MQEASSSSSSNDVGVSDTESESTVSAPLKGSKKPPIYQECPWCDYKSQHPPGLARHIIGIHPEQWRGSLYASLNPGVDVLPARIRHQAEKRKVWDSRYRAKKHAQTTSGARKGSQQKFHVDNPNRAKFREYARRQRERYRARGLNAKGKPYADSKMSRALKASWARRRAEAAAEIKPAQLTVDQRRAAKRAYQREWYDRKGKDYKRAKWRKDAAERRARMKAATLAEPSNSEMPTTEPTRGHIDFCPQCGANLTVYELALGLAQRVKTKGHT